MLVIIIYNQSLFKSNVFKTLVSRTDNLNVYIYDNSPTPQHKKCEFEGTSIYYTSNVNNPGLSYAYNRAAEYAALNNFSWMMLSDQDTKFDTSIIDTFITASNNNTSIKLFAPMVKTGNGKNFSPILYKNHRGNAPLIMPTGAVSIDKYHPINSGLFIETNSFIQVEGYDEAVWLDHSDFQFIERFKEMYNQMFILPIECEQEFSNEVQTPEQKLKRYAIYCDCLKKCKRKNLQDDIDYLYIIFKRMLKLILVTKSLKPIKIFYHNYL